MARRLNASRIKRLRLKFAEEHRRECTLSDEIIQQVIDNAEQVFPLDADLVEDMWDYEP